jgi:diaminopimelate decarboxylase/aspartate kinase
MGWIVLKYGGTSVATAENWGRIAARVRQCLPEGRVWIAASALSQVSNRLLQALAEAKAGGEVDSFRFVRDRHEALGRDLGLDDAELTPVRALLDELGRLFEGVRLIREVSPRLEARVMAFGEQLSTWLGLAVLRRAGLRAVRLDATELLTSDDPPDAPEATRYGEARVDPRRDRARAEALAGDADVVITQGFIARTPEGGTCLLGRGGSDTSAALFAALLEADRLEIWTDVHGMFTTDPRQLPSARLITRIRYREAQELAAMGAKVLHPRCLGPAAFAGVPVEIRNTLDPDASGTRIGAEGDDEPTVMAVVHRKGVPLVSVQTLSMWGVPGFLAKVFGLFAAHGVSIDLVATSQSAVTVTLDHVPEGLDGGPFRALVRELEALGQVDVLPDAGVVSLVGRRIRTVLPELGEAFSAFEERRIHLVSASSEDLNLSFVVDGDDAPRLVRELHARLLGVNRRADWLGPSWADLTGSRTTTAPAAPRWWEAKRDVLLRLAADGQPHYVYDLATVAARAQALVEKLPRVGRRYYAMKANAQPDVLRTIAAAGFGLECVSAEEVRTVRELLGADVPILFTPNFCPVSEYEVALAAGAEVTVDGPDLLTLAPEVFRGRDLGLRLDPGGGQGHHRKVKTAGARSKFGHPVGDVDAFLRVADGIGAKVVGLHAHVGSGILDPDAWARTARILAGIRPRFPALRWVDLGGGLGVVERPGQSPLDLAAVDTALGTVDGLEGLELRMEPGRYLVSEAGVLVVPVTQVRSKGDVTFVGLATGMNSLIRPALYGAWHGIHNLSRLGDPAGPPVEVVGPICETGDVLGHDRALPASTRPGDVLLIENAGAYGAVMSSRYNLRTPADEIALRN